MVSAPKHYLTITPTDQSNTAFYASSILNISWPIITSCSNTYWRELLSLDYFLYSFFSDDTAKRRTQKSKSFKEVEKFDVFVLEKSSGCKFRSLQLLLFAIMSAAFLTLLYTPSVYEHQLQSSSRWVYLSREISLRYSVLHAEYVETITSIPTRLLYRLSLNYIW